MISEGVLTRVDIKLPGTRHDRVELESCGPESADAIALADTAFLYGIDPVETDPTSLPRH